MSVTKAVLAMLFVAAPAAARDNIPDRIGDWRLGAPLGEFKVAKERFIDCDGTVYVDVADGHISALRFTPDRDGCPVNLEDDPEGVWTGLREQITLQFAYDGGIEWDQNPAGDLIFHGEKSVVVLIEKRPSAHLVPEVWVLPVADSYLCFPGDGFAEFYASFRKALAGDPPAKLVRFFAFPFADTAGKKLGAKTRKEFAKKAKRILGEGVRTVVENTKDPECSRQYEGYYVEAFPGVGLWAERVGDVWKWTELAPLASDEE